MIFENLIHDKSYFIMKGGEVLTYCQTAFTEAGIQIMVYDRTSITGTSTLDVANVDRVLTEFSQDYNKELKSFLVFIKRDQTISTILKNYIFALWCGDEERVEELSDEDYTLTEQFSKYLETLLNFNRYEKTVVNYFYARFFEQELIYATYNETWLKLNTQ